ncbi:hypothetical protein BT67DRAFT_433956 [Trichocladium antarcticum]|uniref:BHLH domain-containing protein n=1 Tax=Trichocladium antarcticum TaxID=1450529 RepID=A0AAN6UKK3_9PEZI|nr:hypothetical protein BT67DRAFT_433956 [Trichocladium antarcticum]
MGDQSSESSGPSHAAAHEPGEPDNKGTKSRKRQHGPDPGASKVNKRRASQRKPAPGPTPNNKTQAASWAATVLSPSAGVDRSSAEADTAAAAAAAAPTPTPTQQQQQQHAHSRTRHNIVEQQYRHRLNQQFKHLLDILPATMRDEGEPCASLAGFGLTTKEIHAAAAANGLPSPPLAAAEGSSRGLQNHHGHGAVVAAAGPGEERTGGERRVSKAEVLDRARLYIQALEREHMRLVAERRELDLLWGEHCRREAAVGARRGRR